MRAVSKYEILSKALLNHLSGLSNKKELKICSLKNKVNGA